jgi:hypothetical protein
MKALSFYDLLRFAVGFALQRKDSLSLAHPGIDVSACNCKGFAYGDLISAVSQVRFIRLCPIQAILGGTDGAVPRGVKSRQAAYEFCSRPIS